MPNSFYIFPDQTVSEKKKTKKWHIGHVTNYLQYRSSSGYASRKETMAKLYRAFLCLSTQKEEELTKPITSPHGTDLGVPYQIYNLIEQKIEQLVGDYMKRPVTKKAYLQNKEAQSRKLDAKINTLSEQFFREMAEDIKEKHGIELSGENPEIEVPEDVEEFFSKNYKDPAEETADDVVEKFLEVDKQRQIIRETLTDFLICDECHFRMINDNGTPKWRKVSPLDKDCDSNPHKVVNDNHEYFTELHYKTENDILNDYELTADEKKAIKSYFAILNSYRSGKLKVEAAKGYDIINQNGWYTEEDNIFRVAVVEMIWKSRKTIRGKVTEENQDDWKIIGEKTRLKKNEIEKNFSFELPRHVMMAGPEVCLSWGVDDSRNFKISDKKRCFLNVVSLRRQNTIGVDNIRSVAAKLYKMQEWASEQLFEIRLAFRRNQGKVMVYDTAQTPKQYLSEQGKVNALGRMMHHAKKDGFIFINSKDKNNRYAFNQFTSVDFTTRNLLTDLINGLALIEDLADKMIGLNEGRKGESGQHTTTGNVEAQRQASFSRTEIYYKPFDDFIQASLERMLDFSKNIYKENEFIQYAFGDLRTKFIRIAPEFMNSDIGLYLNDGSKDAAKKQVIDRAAELSLGNAQTEDMILSLIDVLNEDTAVESRAVLQRSVDAMKKMREMREEQEMELRNKEIDSRNAQAAEDDQLTREGHEKDKYVAHVYADQKDKQIDKTTDTDKLIKLADIEAKNIEQSKN